MGRPSSSRCAGAMNRAVREEHRIFPTTPEQLKDPEADGGPQTDGKRDASSTTCGETPPQHCRRGAAVELQGGAVSDRPVHEKTMKSGFLISLAFHGHGGRIPPLPGCLKRRPFPQQDCPTRGWGKKREIRGRELNVGCWDLSKKKPIRFGPVFTSGSQRPTPDSRLL